jgi:hypothetical protein
VSSPSPLPACPRLCIDDLERICRDRASLSENERKRDVLCLSRFAFFRRASPPAQVIYARALDTVAKLGHRSTTFVLESLGFEACTRRHLLPKFGQKQISSRFSVLPCLCHVFPTLIAATTGHQIYPNLFLFNLGITLLLNSLKTRRITAWFLPGRVFKIRAVLPLQETSCHFFSCSVKFS